MIAVTVCASKDYCYALKTQAVRVAANLRDVEGGTAILVGDDSQEFGDAVTAWEKTMPGDWRVESIKLPAEQGLENYKPKAQLLIARLRTAAFARARALRADQCWSLDSDVLPPAHALATMRWALDMPDRFYSVAFCPYPSQGGVAFLGGRGDHRNPILPDFYDEEREIPAELQTALDGQKAKLKDFTNGRPDDEWMEERERLAKKVGECPPKGNVFAMNAKGWRRRGWFDNAFPAIGRGAIVHTDWCGFGCTLMSAAALDAADFSGYDGKGTEDLYVVYKRWAQRGMRIAAIPHCPADHVIRADVRGQKSKVRGQRSEVSDQKYKLQHAYHELDGETAGHLRVESREWHEMV